MPLTPPADPTQPTDPTGETEAGKGLTDKAAETYEWWNNLATLHAEDPFLVGLGKIGIRVFGILVLLALSPLIVVGLMVAFITVL